jgi:hypothetical protein
MQAPTRAAAAAPDARYAMPSVYNQMMLRKLASDTPLLMTSERAGTALPLSAVDVLALRVLTEVAPQDRSRFIHDYVARNVVRLRIGGKVLEEQGELRAAIGAAVEQIGRERLSMLVELGVLAPA